MLLLLDLLISAAGLALAAMAYIKVRKVHLATYQLNNDLSATRRETEALYAQICSAADLKSLLAFDKPMPPMRGWAGSPDFLLHLAHCVLRDKPRAALECSSGISTLVVARCLQRNGTGHVWSLEHEPKFAAKTRALLADHGLEAWATVVDAPLDNRTGLQTAWYSQQALPVAIPEVDLLVVDGPPESTGPMARAPAFEKLRDRLSPRAKVFVDDADRPDETAMVRQWLELEPTLHLERLPAEKGLTVLSRQSH